MRSRTPLTALALLALLASPALSETNVLTGKAAFGGWRDDAPGVVRHLTPADLESPSASQPASNGAQPVPMPDGALPTVKPGFKIELVASGIANPRVLRFAPNGDLFVANSGAGEVLVYRFAGDSPKPLSVSTYVAGLNQPYGIAFYPADAPQWVYIARADGLTRYPYKDGDMVAPPRSGEAILTGIPDGGHWTRDVAFSSDGATLYYSVGSASNVGDNSMRGDPPGGLDAWIASHPLGAAWGAEEGRAAVFAFDPEGKNGRQVATGLRNCAGMALQPATDAIWCVVNERDNLGDNIPFDYATSVRDGHFYGWPWFYIGDNPDPRWARQPRPDLAKSVTIPDVLFQAHSAPLNVAFYTSDAWGPDYRGDAFVALHGSWNRGTRTGYKIVRLDVDAAGKPTGTYEDFVTGFVLNDNDVWGRPVGVAVSPDGALFFSEDGSGTIWKVSRQ